jgi:hypothetical protein
MGNQNTNLDIDEYFVQPTDFRLNNSPVMVYVTDGNEYYLLHYGFGASVAINKIPEDKRTRASTIEFKSHLRDFEAIDAFTSDEIKIGRKEGFGVLVDFCRNKYIKFYKKGDDLKIIVTRWAYTENVEECKRILSGDLGLGYDVCIVRYNGSRRKLCELRDERDEQETTILFSHLKDLS